MNNELYGVVPIYFFVMYFLIVSILNVHDAYISCLPYLYEFTNIDVSQYTVLMLSVKYLSCFYIVMRHAYLLHLLFYFKESFNSFISFLLLIDNITILDFQFLNILELSICRFVPRNAYILAQTYSTLLLRVYTYDNG